MSKTENWHIEIDCIEDLKTDFPYWTIVSKAHGIRLRADSHPDLHAALDAMLGAIGTKYEAAVQAHSKVVKFLDPKDDGGFDQRFLGKDAFNGPDAA